MLQQYGSHGVIGMDSTHGTNMYDFQLTSIMVTDDHGEGFPVAFCISNRIDCTAMAVFLSAVRDVVGYVIPDVILITDDAESYSNAWTQAIYYTSFLQILQVVLMTL